MTKRQTLPSRRPSVVRAARLEDHRFLLDIGFYADGRPAEVFADRPKTDQMGAMLSDACTVISIALQYGISFEALAKSLGEEPDVLRGKGAVKPASPIGTILAEVAAEIAEQKQ